MVLPVVVREKIKKCWRVPPVSLQLQDIFGRTALPPFLFVLEVGEELWQARFQLRVEPAAGSCYELGKTEDFRLGQFSSFLKVYGMVRGFYELLIPKPRWKVLDVCSGSVSWWQTSKVISLQGLAKDGYDWLPLKMRNLLCSLVSCAHPTNSDSFGASSNQEAEKRLHKLFPCEIFIDGLKLSMYSRLNLHFQSHIYIYISYIYIIYIYIYIIYIYISYIYISLEYIMHDYIIQVKKYI